MSKAEQAAATQKTLVRVGRRLFAKRGFDGTSAEEIVAAAQLTRGALYHHYDGKEGLFRAVVRDLMAEVHQRLARSSQRARSPLEAVELGIGAFLKACTEPAYQRILLIDGPAVLGWPAWRQLDLEYGLGLLKKGLEAAVAAGQLELEDVETSTHVLAGALIDAAMLIGRDPKDASLRGRVERAVLGLVRGLAVGR
jgi:AcrR family transcriptional regulator